MSSEGDGGSVERSKGVRTRWVLSPLAGLRRLSRVERALRRRVDSPTAPLLDEQPPRIEVLPDAFDRVDIDSAVDQRPSFGRNTWRGRAKDGRRHAGRACDRRPRAGALEDPARRDAPLPRLHDRRRHAPGRRRPTADRVPRSVGILLHYVAFLGARRLLSLARRSPGDRPGAGGARRGRSRGGCRESTGIKHDILAALDDS